MLRERCRSSPRSRCGNGDRALGVGMTRSTCGIITILGLIGSPVGAQSAPPASPHVIVVHMVERLPYGIAFDPIRVTAQLGDTVRFVQLGGMPHNVEFRSVPTAAAAVLCPKCGTALATTPATTAARVAVPSSDNFRVQEALRASLAPRYELLQPLGHGGMGSVFLARETALKRLVAVKVLWPYL